MLVNSEGTEKFVRFRWSFELQKFELHGFNSTIFQIFKCCNERSPNSSSQFWNHKIRVYSNFASLPSFMKDNSPIFFSSNLICCGQKQPIEVRFWNFWVVEWKSTKFLMSYLKLQVIICLNFVSLWSVMRDNSFELF